MGPVKVFMLRWLSICLMAVVLIACSSSAKAPIGERSPYQRPNPGIHTVQTGESLYSIAWQYGYDYQTVARWNGIKPPYTIFAGQKLRVKPSAAYKPPRPTASQGVSKSTVAKASPKPQLQSKSKQTTPPVKQYPQLASAGPIRFIWPNNGPVIKSFTATQDGKTGIAIGGASGAKIRAAAAGKVVYAGSGLVGYGRLIIIKHNKIFLSAYGHNQNILVKEGDWVTRGQTVASMGSTGTNRTKLHFEIRRYGKPVDPLKYLPKR